MFSYNSQSKLAFLGCLVGWFKKPEYYEIAKKIIAEGDKLLNQQVDILDLHFYYAACMEIHYRNRELDGKALCLAIQACKNQIGINKEVKKKFINDGGEALPNHPSYKQLAIIYEKQNQIEKAILITRECIENGWNIEDAEKRLKRLSKKLEK